MLVSVIIVNYNTFQLTCSCIDSIIKKTSNVDVEIILVDNASSEKDSNEFLRQFPNLILVKSKCNLGFARGNNLGIEKAIGDFVLLLNSDAELKNNAIYHCVTFLEDHPEVAVVSSKLEYPDGAVQSNCQTFPSIWRKIFEILRMQKVFSTRATGEILFGFFFDHKTIAYPDWVWGTFFMFSRKLLSQLPDRKLPDNFFMYVEDMQWCMEFKKLGYKTAFEPAAEVIHHMGKSGGKKSELIELNMKEFMKLYYSGFERRIISWLDRML